MTKLQIVIDRGPDAKPEECGACPEKSSFPTRNGRVFDCFLFRQTALKTLWPSKRPLRCSECLAAEREIAESHEAVMSQHAAIRQLRGELARAELERDAERERCAKVCEHEAERIAREYEYRNGLWWTAFNLAAEIRKGE